MSDLESRLRAHLASEAAVGVDAPDVVVLEQAARRRRRRTGQAGSLALVLIAALTATGFLARDGADRTTRIRSDGGPSSPGESAVDVEPGPSTTTPSEDPPATAPSSTTLQPPA